MTEFSMWWDSTGTGDGDAGGLTEANLNQMFRMMTGITGTNKGGVWPDYLNELAVTGTSSPVAVNTGAGNCYGFMYHNSASVNVAVATPATSTRVDYIVLRASWSAQTVRITRVAGTEGAGAPSLTQTDGVTWDIPLATASITTGGVITVTDAREWLTIVGDGGVSTVKLAADAVDGTKIADDAVNSEHIAAGAVDLEHMSANSVDSDQYVDGSIDLAHMSANSVDSDQYVDGSIDLIHMSANSVDSDQYVDGSIDTVHIAADQITSALIADDQIDSEHIAAGAVDLEHMSANSVDSDQYVDGSIDGVHIANDAIDSQHYANGSVDGIHISNDAIDSQHYANLSIDEAHLAAASVTTTKIADGDVTQAKLGTDTLGIITLSLVELTGTAGITVANTSYQWSETQLLIYPTDFPAGYTAYLDVVVNGTYTNFMCGLADHASSHALVGTPLTDAANTGSTVLESTGDLASALDAAGTTQTCLTYKVDTGTAYIISARLRVQW